MNPKSPSVAFEPGDEPSAVLLYDSVPRAIEARAILGRAAKRAGEPDEWKLKLWRAELLQFPSMAEAAFTEAEAASLVFLAVCPSVIPLPWMKGWIERWAAGRKVADACLALWENRVAATQPGSGAEELGRIVRRHGVSLVVASPSTREPPASRVAGDLQSRESEVTPTLRGILAQPAPNPFRH